MQNSMTTHYRNATNNIYNGAPKKLKQYYQQRQKCDTTHYRNEKINEK